MARTRKYWLVLAIQKWDTITLHPTPFNAIPISTEKMDGAGYCVVFDSLEEAEAWAEGARVVELTETIREDAGESND